MIRNADEIRRPQHERSINHGDRAGKSVTVQEIVTNEVF